MTESWGSRSEYTIPEGYTTEQVRLGVIELQRPCSPTITGYFAKLEAFRPFYEPDPKNPDKHRKQLFYDGLYDDVKDYPEIAVILALEDMRKNEGKIFPTVNEIMEQVKSYASMIDDLKDFK